jgi:hypothetical protein
VQKIDSLKWDGTRGCSLGAFSSRYKVPKSTLKRWKKIFENPSQGWIVVGAVDLVSRAEIVKTIKKKQCLEKLHYSLLPKLSLTPIKHRISAKSAIQDHEDKTPISSSTIPNSLNILVK